MAYLTSFDLAHIIKDAKSRKRKTVYLPYSIYEQKNLDLVRKYYGAVYKINEVTGKMNGLMISVDETV